MTAAPDTVMVHPPAKVSTPGRVAVGWVPGVEVSDLGWRQQNFCGHSASLGTSAAKSLVLLLTFSRVF